MFTSGCFGSGGDAEIAEIRQTDDPRVLEVAVYTCNAELTPEVTETADDAALSISQKNNAVGDDCPDSIGIELDRPLADRTILLSDGSTFRPLPYPTPTPIDSTPSGQISFCGRDDFEQPDPDLVDSDTDLGRHYEQVDRASLPIRHLRRWWRCSARGSTRPARLRVGSFSRISLTGTAPPSRAVRHVPGRSGARKRADADGQRLHLGWTALQPAMRLPSRCSG